MKQLLIISLSVILLLWIIIHFGNDLIRMFESDIPSKSVGTVKKGNLVNGKRLPSNGGNFITYSRFGSLIGRNAVHQNVRDAVLDAYSQIFKNASQYIYVIGETSWPGGGKFWPHKTHQNGLSVDFMVPVMNTSEEPVTMPSHIFNKFGYGIEFDSLGRYEDFKIDFEAIALHLLQLKKSSEKFGLKIEVVIFDNAFQRLLFKTKYGKELKNSLRFSKLKPWVRHDEHYHVDFALIPGNKT